MKISIIGCGNMGTGIARRLAPNHQLSLYDRDHAKTQQLAGELKAFACKSMEEAAANSEIIILAVKPQNLNDLTHLKFNAQQIVVSILTGVTTKTLKHHFSHVAIVRMMPNLAIIYGEGIIGVADSPDLSSETRNKIATLCSTLGSVFWLHEDKIDALTSVGGSGPAFVLIMIESMIDAAIAMGFKPEEARQFVLKMLSGTLTMLKETGKHPAELRWQVTSPAGTTIAGIKKLEEEKVRAGIMNTFLAAYQRAQQLSTLK